MNSVTKAVIAALAGFVATIQAQPPGTTAQWIQAVASGLGVGLITWYVPNTDNKTGVMILPK